MPTCIDCQILIDMRQKLSHLHLNKQIQFSCQESCNCKICRHKITKSKNLYTYFSRFSKSLTKDNKNQNDKVLKQWRIHVEIINRKLILVVEVLQVLGLYSENLANCWKTDFKSKGQQQTISSVGLA